jgi:hypothetical protein
MHLSDISIHAWIQEFQIKTEKGELLDFRYHLFLFDIYRDQSQYLIVMKAAQIGLSTLEILKNFYDAKRFKMDIIYTLPTDSDVQIFVGGKVNRIIAENPVLLEYTKDKDTVEQKKVGSSMIYFRGTWTKKAAIMVTADRLVHDEKDSSKQDVVSDYQARLQHSKFKQIHTFSHPSASGFGVDVEWQQSDQKEWFITCPHCKKEQYLRWPDSIDLDKKEYTCLYCDGVLSDDDRRKGRWRARVFKDSQGNIIKKKYSGYHVSLLMAPWVSAQEIVEKFNDKNSDEEFFFNKVLGLPYVGSGNKLTRPLLMQNLVGEVITPDKDERIVIGVDTGLKLDYVMGGENGLFFHGEATKYEELDEHMRRWPRAIAIVDQGGDLIGSREFKERWPGRVFLCLFGEDRKTEELVRWGAKDEHGAVTADRNRMISLVVDEFRKKRVPIQGTEDDWYDYWLDWNNLTRKKIIDPVTEQFKGYKWVRSGRDHRALATPLFIGVLE